jgi:xanthine dehydrogenase accessory factor
MVILEDGKTYGTLGGGCVESYIVSEAKNIIKEGQMKVIECDLGDDSWSGLGMACGGKVEVAIEVIEPKPRIIILGAGHIGKALYDISEIIGYRTTIIDPFANKESFPKAEIIKEDFVEGFSKISVNSNDYIVIVTKHHDDERTLRSVVESDVPYIGMIGSKNRVNLVFRSLIDQGYSPNKVLRVHAPIGLDINAQTPEEIAISIISEIIMTYLGGTGNPMGIKKIEKHKSKEC